MVEFSVAAYGRPVTAVAGGLLAFAAAALGDAEAEIGVMAALAAGPWLAGWFARPLHRESQELTQLAARLERGREAGARLAVAEERARLAREIHDAVAHAVSAMVVQAAAADAVWEHGGRASGSLRAVQEPGRDVDRGAAPRAAHPAPTRRPLRGRRRPRRPPPAPQAGAPPTPSSRSRASPPPSGWR